MTIEELDREIEKHGKDKTLSDWSYMGTCSRCGISFPTFLLMVVVSGEQEKSMCTHCFGKVKGVYKEEA